MQGDGQGNVDCIDVILSQQLIVRAVSTRNVIAFGVSLGFGQGAGSDSDNQNVWVRFGWVVEPNGSESGCTKDAEADCVRRLVDREFVEFVVPPVESEEELFRPD